MRKHTQAERGTVFADPKRYADDIPIIRAEIAEEEAIAGAAFITEMPKLTPGFKLSAREQKEKIRMEDRAVRAMNDANG